MLVVVDAGVLPDGTAGAEASNAGTGGSCTRKSGVLKWTVAAAKSVLFCVALESVGSKDGASVIGVSVDCTLVGICALSTVSIVGDAVGSRATEGESISILPMAEATDVGEGVVTLRRSEAFARARCRLSSNRFDRETTLRFVFGACRTGLYHSPSTGSVCTEASRYSGRCPCETGRGGMGTEFCVLDDSGAPGDSAVAGDLETLRLEVPASTYRRSDDALRVLEAWLTELRCFDLAVVAEVLAPSEVRFFFLGGGCCARRRNVSSTIWTLRFSLSVSSVNTPNVSNEPWRGAGVMSRLGGLLRDDPDSLSPASSP